MSSFSIAQIETKHITFSFCLIVTITLVILFHLRSRWLPRFRAWLSRRRLNGSLYNSIPSFQDDIEQGLTSNHFDLEAHNANDSRKGLDEEAKLEIQKIMNDTGISFDEARLAYTRKKLDENNIGPDGTPLDPRAVTFIRK